jgi:hypothetical protein
VVEADITGLPSTNEAAGNGVVELAMAVLWPWRRSSSSARAVYSVPAAPVPRSGSGRPRACVRA